MTVVKIQATGYLHQLPKDIVDFLITNSMVPDANEIVVGWYEMDDLTGVQNGNGGFHFADNTDDNIHELIWDEALACFIIPEDMSTDDKKSLFDVCGNIPFNESPTNTLLH